MTQRDYLENSYQYAGEARVLRTGSDDDGYFVVLDRTVFYPQGGGQPSDKGVIRANDKEYPIRFVTARDREVFHYGQNEELLELTDGSLASLQIDESSRLFNARNHTAGHIVSFVAERLFPNLKGYKGFHFPEGSYVEFLGRIESPSEDIVEKLQNACQEIIDSNASITIQSLTAGELNSFNREVPGQLDETERIRVMSVCGDVLPCGGTHVNNTGEVGFISIKKVKGKGDKTKVSYSIN